MSEETRLTRRARFSGTAVRWEERGVLSCTSSAGAALVDACMMCWETAAVRWDAVRRALRDMLVRREETNMARLQRSPAD